MWTLLASSSYTIHVGLDPLFFTDRSMPWAHNLHFNGFNLEKDQEIDK